MKVSKRARRIASRLLPDFLLGRILRGSVRIPALLPPGTHFKIAETEEELDAAFRLLHDVYVEVGLMKPDPSGMRVTPYHALPSSTTVVGKVGNRVVATLTIIRDNPLGLPCEHFTDLSRLRTGGARIAEISALAIEPGFRGLLLFHLMKFMYELCVKYLGVDHLIATLTTDSGAHQLYEAFLFFKPLEQKVETNYAFSNFRPVIAEHLCLREAPAIFERFYRGKPLEQDLHSFFVEETFIGNHFPTRAHGQIDYRVMQGEMFRNFFTVRTSALKKMNPSQLIALRWVFRDGPEAGLVNQVLREEHGIFSLERDRRDQRFPVNCLGWVREKERIGESAVRILDVSRGGLRIQLSRHLAFPRSVVLLTEDGYRYEVPVVKAWESEDGVVGLRVTSAPPQWHRMIGYFERESGRDVEAPKEACAS